MSDCKEWRLVTGGGGGLGRAGALTLGQRGARVALHDFKSRDGAKEAVAALTGRASRRKRFRVT